MPGCWCNGRLTVTPFNPPLKGGYNTTQARVANGRAGGHSKPKCASRVLWPTPEANPASREAKGKLNTGWLASQATRVSRHDVHARDAVNL